MDDKIRKLVDKGAKLMEEGNYEDALSCFEQALIIKTNDPDIWNKKGTALRSLGRYDEAIDCFNKSLEISPRDLEAS